MIAFYEVLNNSILSSPHFYPMQFLEPSSCVSYCKGPLIWMLNLALWLVSDSFLMPTRASRWFSFVTNSSREKLHIKTKSHLESHKSVWNGAESIFFTKGNLNAIHKEQRKGNLYSLGKSVYCSNFETKWPQVTISNLSVVAINTARMKYPKLT